MRSTTHQLAWQWATTTALLGVGGVEDPDDVGHVGGAGVLLDRRRPAGSSISPTVERDDPVPPGEVGEQRLPDP